MEPVTSQTARQASRWRLFTKIACGAIVIYLVIAYTVIPLGWMYYAHRHPALDQTPGITITGDDHPGDPINVALIGSEDDVKEIMRNAKWFPADPLGWRSDLKIAADTVLSRPYTAAPVSNLYLFGRKEDLAFEQPVGVNPRQRHHVRFWKSTQLDDQARPLWSGSATYDKKVGLSHTSGQITHHIAADVDAERDHLFSNLLETSNLIEAHYENDFHKVREGRNGGGDAWHTDGRLRIGTVQTAIPQK
jgi:hypothetical protein